MHNEMKHCAVLLLGAALMLCPASLGAQTAQLKGSLNQLFNIAEAHNASLRTVRAAISEAEEGIRSAKKAQLPDVNAQLSVSYLGNARIWNRHFGEGVCAEMPHFGNNFLLQAQQVVYAGGALSAGIQLAKQNASLQNLNAADERRRVQFLLTGLYLQLHNLQNQADVYAANKELAQKQILLMQQRYAKGVSLHSDITRYELYLQQVELGITSVTDQADIVRQQLLTALGTDSASIATLPESAFADDAITVGSETDWQLLAAEQHPGVQSLALGVQMSRTQEKLERSALLPKIAIVAEDHLDGPITIEVPPINKNLNYWFVGVGVTYNFSALYKNRSKVRRAKLHTAWQNESLTATRENVSDAVHAAYVSLGTAQTQLNTRRKSLQLATENYELVSRRYQNGLAIVTDLTDAANMKLDAELQLSDARINLVYAFYNLKYAAGCLEN
jgi:outer membrane protein